MANLRAELLAPAGGPEAGYAAVQAGADAVYLGLSRFSARAEAVNFTSEELADFAGYAHQLGRKVYVTVNTLIQTAELPELLRTLAILSACRVDALIVQDLGVLRLIRRHFPHLAIHGSTQLAVHNRAGAEYLRELGVKRVTLARELTIAEVADICAVGGIEVETFLHGALCYSYSGLCMFSALQRNGRSANRGRCAYPCRDLFSRCPGGEPDSEEPQEGEAVGQQGHIFSLKDLALPQQLQQLCSAGIASLKIEGRKKSPLYVSTVVSMYRRLLDGGGIDETFEEDRRRVQTVFSRPWTDFFSGSDGRHQAIDAEIVGHRGAVAGTAELVRVVKGERRLRFTTTLGLERHDGLQVDLPGQSRPYGFPVLELYRVEDEYTPRVYDVPAGTRLEVALPDAAPHIPEGAVLYRSSSQELKRDLRMVLPKPGSCAPRPPVRVGLTIDAGTVCATAEFLPDATAALALPLGIVSGCAPVSAVLEGDWTPARQAGSGEGAARQVFDKTGDTPYALSEFQYRNPDNRFVPVSRLNALRRELYAALQQQQEQACEDWLAGLLPAERQDSAPVPAEPALTAGAEEEVRAKALRWSLKVAHPRQLGGLSLGELESLEEIVVDLNECRGEGAKDFFPAMQALGMTVGQQRVRLSLPAILRAADLAELQPLLKEFRQLGFTKFEAGNVGGLRLARGLGGGDVAADWPLYVLNPEAASFLTDDGNVTRFCCSPEDDGENLRALLRACGERTGATGRPLREALSLVAYLDVPLFTGEACARSALTGCRGDGAACSGKPLAIQDSYGARYLLLSRNCRTTLISTRALCLAGRLNELSALGLRHVRADFLYRAYSPDEIAAIFHDLLAGRAPAGSREGNYAAALQ